MGKECDRISTKYYTEKHPGEEVSCVLCGAKEEGLCGEFLAFQSGRRQTTVHLNCIKYTNVVDTSEIAESRMGNEFQNVFESVEASKNCETCQRHGATISCSNSECEKIYHFSCAEKSSWSFEKNGKVFKCSVHRVQTYKNNALKDEGDAVPDETPSSNSGFSLQHNLLAQFGAKNPSQRENVPGNLDIGGTLPPPSNHSSPEEAIEILSDSDESLPGEDALGIEVMDIPLTTDLSGPKQLVRIERSSRDELWNLSLKFEKKWGSNVVSVADVPANSMDFFSLQKNDILISMNGAKVGSEGLQTLRDVLFRMKQEVDIMLQVVRK